MPASIYTATTARSYISLRDTKMNTNLFLNCRPTGQIRGSDLRVKINYLAGQGDPTRMKPRVSRINRKVAGRDGSGQEASKISRVGSGHVNMRHFFCGSGRVPDPTREVWPDPRKALIFSFPTADLRVFLFLLFFAGNCWSKVVSSCRKT